MVTINDKSNCCGCTACAAVCPQQCITMKEDNEGFLYPFVNSLACVNCRLCEKVCPIEKGKNERENSTLSREEYTKERLALENNLPEFFVAYNKNNSIRDKSTSGGLFYAIY